MIRKILFPVDFSSSCEAMAAYVRRAAEMFRAQVTLIHVCDPASHNGFELVVRSPQDIAEEHLSVAVERLDSFLQSDFPPAAYRRIVLRGEASEEISQ